jgi:N-acylneuraminate cytidylyltransferase
MKKIGFVPLRGGSKSIPLKNIKILNGKPLCYWILNAFNSSNLDEIYVATDSDQIKEVVNSFGFAKVNIYNREPLNAQDTSSTESVMLEFLTNHPKQNEDIFVLGQATSPFITSTHINEALDVIQTNNYDSLLSGVNTKRFFWDYNNNQPLNYDYAKRPRRQDFKGYFMENGAFYINSVKNILQHKNRLFGKVYLYEMDDMSALEIDEQLDWKIAEILMQSH